MREVVLSFTTLQFYDNYVVSIVNSGVDLGSDRITELGEVIKKEFGDKPFGYISCRTNDYSLDPIKFMSVIRESNVRAAAFVLTRKISYDSFESEKYFYQLPLATFSDIESAKKWMVEYMESNYD